MPRRKERAGRRLGWSTAANEVVNRVFAYGTFRDGESARAMIAGHVASTTPATTRGRIYAFPEGYPGIVDEAGTVVGEVLALTDLAAGFALLDAYEGDDYERTLRKVTLADGSEQWAWIYMLRDPASVHRTGTLIPDGDWVRWRKSHA